MKAALGLDFGTESVRAMLVDLRGKELASVAVKYPHGQIIETLPGSKRKLPPHYALQHPLDWLGSAAQAARSARRKAKIGAADVIGIGVDFNSTPRIWCRPRGWFAWFMIRKNGAMLNWR